MKIFTRLFALALLLGLPSAVPTAGQIAGGALPTNKLSSVGRHIRVICVDSTRRQCDFGDISDALAYVAKADSTKRNWTTRWTVLVYPGAGGSTDPDAMGVNYTESTLTIPAWTEVTGVTSGHNNTAAWQGGVPVIELTGTAGSLIKLGGGASLSNLRFHWSKTPTAAVKMLEHVGVADADTANNNVEFTSQLTNVAFGLLAGSNAFAVDGIVESGSVAQALYVYGGGLSLSGNALGKAVVNNGGEGITIYGGRYSGSSGCATLMSNTSATGNLKIFDARLELGCTNDLVRASTGTVEVYGGTSYGPASGVITHGITHLPFGTAPPGTCSVGSAFVDTDLPGICVCSAANTWKCATGS